APMDATLAKLFSANAQWAAAVNQSEPGFFAQTAKGQAPKILWLGCSDSRVPESVITAARPGDIFVHRNVANQVHLHDDSILSVIAYSVDVVGIDHSVFTGTSFCLAHTTNPRPRTVLLVGHTHCGGALACYNAAQTPSEAEGAADSPLGRWLAPLTTLAGTLDVSAPPAEGLTALVEANVRAQVANIIATPTVSDAWAAGRKLWVHGLVYDLATGTLRDLGVTKGTDGACA
ncbi:carbonic anhydrase, partial [Gloeopeniophorella convolvens]